MKVEIAADIIYGASDNRKMASCTSRSGILASLFLLQALLGHDHGRGGGRGFNISLEGEKNQLLRDNLRPSTFYSQSNCNRSERPSRTMRGTVEITSRRWKLRGSSGRAWWVSGTRPRTCGFHPLSLRLSASPRKNVATQIV